MQGGSGGGRVRIICAFFVPENQVNLSVANWHVGLGTTAGRLVGAGLGAAVTALGFASYRIGEQNT